ncbi:MAG: FadR/GntR family transcriptional regulator [Acidimicrobiales bacterium]
MTEIWKPVKEPGNLTDRIVTRIDELVDADRIAPGGRLPAEREMARMLGVSRPALREALKVLEVQGRLVVKHGQGVFVARNAGEAVAQRLANLELTLLELYDMRAVLEVPASGWAAEVVTPHDIARLADALAAEEAARVEPIDFTQLGKLDAAFHLVIVEVASNRFLSQTVGVLQEMLASGMETTLTVAGRVGASREEHRRIFEAIVSGNAEAARKMVTMHIDHARSAALTRVRNDASASRNGGSPAS